MKTNVTHPKTGIIYSVEFSGEKIFIQNKVTNEILVRDVITFLGGEKE